PPHAPKKKTGSNSTINSTTSPPSLRNRDTAGGFIDPRNAVSTCSRSSSRLLGTFANKCSADAARIAPPDSLIPGGGPAAFAGDRDATPAAERAAPPTPTAVARPGTSIDFWHFGHLPFRPAYSSFTCS